MLKLKNIIILISLFCLFVSPIFAQENLISINKNITDSGQSAGYEVIGQQADINVIIGKIIKYILSFLGVIFLALLIYGGFLWMNAKGSDDEIDKAKETMVNATIGLTIVLGAYMISSFIVKSISSTTLLK